VVRATARGASGWVFGLAATILFISLWGRAIVVDTDALAEAAAPLSGSVAVIDLFSDWLGEELVDSGVDPSLADPAVEYVLETSEVGLVIDHFVREVVEAAALPGPQAAAVDIAELLSPVVPEIADTLASAGVPVDEAEVASVVGGLEPLVVREAEASPYVGVSSPIAARLGTAAGLAMLVMALAGWVAITASDDRLAETRRLLVRVALGGLSFGILLRVGSWVLDPGGGRAPIPESMSVLVGSKWMVPISIALAAAAMAGMIWGVRRLLRPRGDFPTPVEQSTPEPEPHLSLRG
jgi:hypothetical protein